MKKNSNEKIMMLQYRIKRYHAMGNGTMCQTLNGQLQKLLSYMVFYKTQFSLIICFTEKYSYFCIQTNETLNKK